MALLTKEQRKTRFKYLGLGEYNKANILKFQKKAFPNNKAEQDSKYGVNTDRALRTFYNVKKYAPNFKPTEFRCTCGHCTGYPSYMKKVELQHIQKIRNHYKKPMKITSALRCSFENNRVNGVKNSGHTRGYAVDFYMAGVTDSVDHRVEALKWIKKQPDHEFTYGAYMKDSNGLYRIAKGMGNAMHTETHKPEPTLADKILAACSTQAKWMKNYTYKWESNPTIEKSKKRGTCVTYVACVLQRLGYLKSGKYIWHDGKGKVTHANSKMTVTYPSGTLKSLKGKLKAGDVVIAGDKKNTEAGSHIFIVTGKWTDKDNPYIWDNHSAERIKKGYTGKRAYIGSKKVIAVVRLK